MNLNQNCPAAQKFLNALRKLRFDPNKDYEAIKN